MNKLIIVLALLLVHLQASGHHLWIQTSSRGEVGQEQEIRIYFGEYTYGLMEAVNGESFQKVRKFSLWIVDGKGEKMQLPFSAGEDYYFATFTPQQEGTYLVVLDNDQIDVIDYTQYNFGIFKTHYHSVARIQVGEKKNDTGIYNPEGITFKNLSVEPGKVRLQVYFRHEISPDQEVNVFIADQWSKKMHTDENGMVAFDLPLRNTQYIVEFTRKEEVPGTFRGKDYAFIWHCVTHYLDNNTGH